MDSSCNAAGVIIEDRTGKVKRQTAAEARCSGSRSAFLPKQYRDIRYSGVVNLESLIDEQVEGIDEFRVSEVQQSLFPKKRVLLRNVRDAHALRSVLCYHSKYA
jgi:hypothetical protein